MGPARTIRAMNVARILILVSAAVFAVTGVAYLIAPATMLSIVGVAPSATSDFLLRTEGVALVCGAGLLLAVRDGGNAHLRIALIALALFYVLGSVVDLAAYRESIVTSPALPSAAVRIVFGAICLFVAERPPLR